MALRSVVGKLGNRFIHNNVGRLMMVGTLETQAINKHNHNKKDVLSMAPGPFDFGGKCHEINRVPFPLITNKRRGFDYHMDLGGLGPAHIALEEFNLRKKSQLQIVRLERTWMRPSSHKDGSCYCIYHVMFEAVDAVGVVKFYQADLLLDDVTQGIWLTEFHVFQDNTGYPSRLYHYLDNFYGE
ncbi:hypothetical protein M0R45_001898 [Rubus argutus]|uniref:Uncharacterized protein n=1 Tax=Rubus argutus TaxID=59490 RepID=A0AAW1VKZ8_RUBAR